MNLRCEIANNSEDSCSALSELSRRVERFLPPTTEFAISYGKDSPARQLVLPDHCLWKNKAKWLVECREILQTVSECKNPAELCARLFRRGEDGWVADHDLPMVCFGLLNRWEEELATERDEHGRWQLGSSLMNDGRLIERPVVDWIAMAIAHALAGDAIQQPREWKVALSFDVDSAGMYRGHAFGSSVRRLMRERGVCSAIGGVCEGIRVRAGSQRDSHLMFDEIADELDDLGVVSTFFVQALRAAPLDNYSLSREPQLVLELRRLAQRGHEIGLHGSYSTADRDARFLRQQRNIVQQMTGHPVRLHRHHYLRTTTPANNELYAGADLRADCSPGFSEREGFRLGTAHPVRVGEGLWCIPVHVMDVTLRYHRGMNPEQAFDATTRIMNEAKRVGGTAVLLWHPHNMEPRLWRVWERLPYELVKWAISHGAEPTTIGSLLDTMQSAPSSGQRTAR